MLLNYFSLGICTITFIIVNVVHATNNNNNNKANDDSLTTTTTTTTINNNNRHLAGSNLLKCTILNPLIQQWDTCMVASQNCASNGIYVKWTGPTCNVLEPQRCVCFTWCQYGCQDQCELHASDGCVWKDNKCSNQLTLNKPEPDFAGFCYVGPSALASGGGLGGAGQPTIPWLPPTKEPTRPLHPNQFRVSWKDCSLNNPDLQDPDVCLLLSKRCHKFGVYMKYTGETCQSLERPQCACATRCNIYKCQAMCQANTETSSCQWIDGECQTTLSQIPNPYGYCMINPGDGGISEVTSRPSTSPHMWTSSPSTKSAKPTSFPTPGASLKPTSKPVREYEYEMISTSPTNRPTKKKIVTSTPSVSPTNRPTNKKSNTKPPTRRPQKSPTRHEYEYEQTASPTTPYPTSFPTALTTSMPSEQPTPITNTPTVSTPAPTPVKNSKPPTKKKTGR
jgi:hypothetical protein